MELPNAPQNPPPLFETGPKRGKKWYQKWWGKIIMVILVLVLIFIVAFAFQVVSYFREIKNQSAGTGSLTDLLPRNRADLSTIISPNDPSLGPKDARVVVVEFSDFECPFCQQAFPVVKQLLQDYGDQILYVYKDFPLTDIHERAVPAALAAQCAHEQGQFWLMHDKIFENQDNLTDANLKRYAVQIGLNSLQFGNCFAASKYLGEIQQDFNQGLKLGVKSTPTFFINGIGIPGAVPLATLEQIVVAELNR